MKKKKNVNLVILFAIMIFSFAIVYLSTSFIEVNLDFTEWEREIQKNVVVAWVIISIILYLIYICVVIAWAIISIILNLIYIGVTCINKEE